MKRFLVIFCALLAAVTLVLGCASKPKTGSGINPPAATVKTYPPQIIEHKGSAFGLDYPAWLKPALEGPKSVEKLPEYQNKYVVTVQEDGADLAGVQLAASRLEAQPTISQLVSTRVKDTFAGAQVGDKDKIETYMERCVKSLSSARFSGFGKQNEWWVRLQTFTSNGKPDRQLFRIIQVWAIDRDYLMQQIDQVLKDEAAKEPGKTTEKQRAIDLVQQSLFQDF